VRTDGDGDSTKLYLTLIGHYLLACFALSLGGMMFTLQARWRLKNVNFKLFEKVTRF
jgi:hypothetical protein